MRAPASDTAGNGGAGFGVMAKPMGMFVIRDGDAVWRLASPDDGVTPGYSVSPPGLTVQINASQQVVVQARNPAGDLVLNMTSAAITTESGRLLASPDSTSANRNSA